MKTKILIIVSIMCLNFVHINAQTKVNTNVILDYPLGHIFSKLKDSQGNDINFKTATSWIWKRQELNNMRLSFAVSINNKIGRIDYIPSLAFGNKAFLIFDDPNDEDIATNHVAWYVQPSVDFRIKLKDPIENPLIPTITIGTAYRYNVMYRKKRGVYGGAFKDYFNYPKATDKNIDNVNSGLTVRFGLGLLRNDSKNLERISLSLLYEHDLFNFFNQNYEVNSVKPYDGMRTNIGMLYLRLTGDL